MGSADLMKICALQPIVITDSMPSMRLPACEDRESDWPIVGACDLTQHSEPIRLSSGAKSYAVFAYLPDG
jgi:hypothetical protein